MDMAHLNGVVQAVVLPPSIAAGPDVQGRLDRLRELGVEVLPSDDGAAAAEGLRGGPEPVLVLSLAGGSDDGVSGAPARAIAVERPADALALLDRLIDAQAAFPEPVEDPGWLVEVDGFDPYREREVESWLAIGNGRTGTRGSLEEGSEHSSPGCYVAGVYGWPDREPPGPELVPGPEWTRLAPRVEAEPLELGNGVTVSHRRVLDLRQAILFRSWRQRLPSGVETSFRSARFASLAERELLALEAQLETDGQPGELAAAVPVTAGGRAGTADARERDGLLRVDVRGRRGGAAGFAVASESAAGRIERLVAVSPAARGASPGVGAEERLGRARADGIGAVRARHRAAWRERWRGADVVVEGDADAQRALRFSLYHLISAADPESDRASVGARGLTGPGYRGHVFWDAEAFVLPFFVFTHPETARALLGYRARTLPAARKRARALGYRGALYAWESADTGEDVTPPFGLGFDGRRVPILTGLQEHHISADVAWAVWRYWQASGDEAFLAETGTEILVETARFWASRARRGRDGRYHIGRVIGPDEYHEGVRDNAFTNALARWNLERALELLERTGPVEWLGTDGRELERWRTVAAGLHDGFDPQTGLYEQFAGFFELEDLRAAELAPRPFSPDAILGAERVRRSQLVKQADVLMLAHMLPEVVSVGVARANYDYYEPRTSHGSSLSPAVHAAVAARIGKLEEALAYFRMAASIDLSDAMGSTAQGIHIATMGGLWQAAVLGFGGVHADGGALRLEPRLPPAWRRLAFPLRWRDTTVRVDARPDELVLVLDGPARLALGGAPARDVGAGRYRATARAGGWSALREERP